MSEPHAQSATLPPSGSGQPRRTADRMWRDTFLPPGLSDVRTTARSAVATHLAPHARTIAQAEETAESFPWEAFRGLGSAGLFGVPFEKPYGPGFEHPLLATCITAEEIGYESSSMAGVYDGQCLLVPQALSFADPELRAELLPTLISGSQAYAFATTEPGASSDLSVNAMRTELRESDQGLVLNGRKRWITNSVVASWAAVLCRDGDRMTMVLVDMASEGVCVGEPDKKMGHRGQITADIEFSDVFVPSRQILGERGQGMTVALSTLTRGRIGIGAVGVGVAQAGLDLAVQHLERRRVFGKLLGEMQHWQYKFAEHAAAIESARNLYYKAAICIDQGSPRAEPEASMAKIAGSRVANAVASDALQVHGGYGFAREIAATGEQYRLEEIYRDAKILEIFEGANEVLLWVVARQLLGRGLTG